MMTAEEIFKLVVRHILVLIVIAIMCITVLTTLQLNSISSSMRELQVDLKREDRTFEGMYGN